MKCSLRTALLLAPFCLPFCVQPAFAQTSTSNSSAIMWGTVAGGVSVPGALDSAVTHYQNGAVAGQVNAAKIGSLYGNGTGGTIQAIGSQNIISATIIGNNSIANMNGETQTSSNTGAVTNHGQVAKTINGNQN
jgi:hypothetical protein